MRIAKECRSCHEKREHGCVLEFPRKAYWLCDDCIRKVEGIIEGGVL